MPPKQGRPAPPRPLEGQVARRRARRRAPARGFLGSRSLAVSAFGDSDAEKPPPATTVAAAAADVLHIVFPEGFTRKEMATRVAAVRQIAKDEAEGDSAALRQQQYLC